MIDQWVHQNASMPAFALSELDALVQNGVLQPDSLIRHISSEEWLSVSEVMAAVARHADSEKANQSAERVLRNMATQRLHAKPSEKKTTGNIAVPNAIGDTIKSGLWAIPEAATNVVVHVSKWALRYVKRRAILCTSLVASIATLLWVSGVFEPTPKDLPDQLNEIWRNAIEFSSDSAGDAKWNTFAQENLTRLAAISSQLETAQQNRGVFGAFAYPDDNRWARWELMQAAKYEIPLALKAGPAKLPEFADAVESRLLRYEEFVARSSQPRLHNNIVFSSDATESGTGSASMADTDISTWLLVGFDVIFVLGVLSWWIRRRSSGRSHPASSK